jgi:uncharacterized protein (TIGR02996 family)
MNEREALLLAIAANPAEDTPRLVYADWLDEYGDGEVARARAEFIRTQIALLAYRASVLLTKHETQFRRPMCVACLGSGRRPMENEFCYYCNGSGSTGALSTLRHDRSTEFATPVTWVRGFPVVSVPFAGMSSSRLDTYSNYPWSFNTHWLAWAVRCVRKEGASFTCPDWHNGNVSAIPAVIMDEV